ncbi:MAG: hypothetical protein HOM11_09430, partial [Methylococcales bacterium]|nr:hypothetical protein [Methylococcales bacterium]
MVTQKKDYVYTQNFCEENIWQLGRQLQAEGEDVADFEVLMLSNEVRQIPLLSHQPSSEPIVWDYHVILRQKSKPLMFDFDSVLPFPCSTADYHEQTFMADDQIGSRWVVWARCIPLNRYLPAFYSNRAHMIDA